MISGNRKKLGCERVKGSGRPPKICPLVLCLTSGGNRPRILLFGEIKDNIVNKPLKNNIILKLTIII